MAARMVSVAIGEGVAGLKGTRSQRSRVAAVRAASTAEPVGEATSSKVSSVSIEYQRQRAKEMTKYFNSLKVSPAMDAAPGWTACAPVAERCRPGPGPAERVGPTGMYSHICAV